MKKKDRRKVATDNYMMLGINETTRIPSLHSRGFKVGKRCIYVTGEALGMRGMYSRETTKA